MVAFLLNLIMPVDAEPAGDTIPIEVSGHGLDHPDSPAHSDQQVSCGPPSSEATACVCVCSCRSQACDAGAEGKPLFFKTGSRRQHTHSPSTLIVPACLPACQMPETGHSDSTVRSDDTAINVTAPGVMGGMRKDVEA
jgi:hypothetical protein